MTKQEFLSKNKILYWFPLGFKKITIMWKRWGTSQNFCLAFIDKLEKQLYLLKKKCWSGPIKNVRILTFTMMYILKKKTPGDIIILNLCTKNLDYMIYSSWNKECDYGTFSALSSTPKKPKNQNLKKNCWRYHHFTQVHQKPQSCKAQFLVYRVRQAKLFVILGDFLPFLYPINPKKSKF